MNNYTEQINLSDDQVNALAQAGYATVQDLVNNSLNNLVNKIVADRGVIFLTAFQSADSVTQATVASQLNIDPTVLTAVAAQPTNVPVDNIVTP